MLTKSCIKISLTRQTGCAKLLEPRIGVIRMSQAAIRVSLKSNPHYLHRVRTIMDCLADSVGMNQQEADDAKLVLTEACAHVMKSHGLHGKNENILLTLRTGTDSISLDLKERDCSGFVDDDRPDNGITTRIMRALADSVEYIRRKTGITVRIKKNAESYTRVGKIPQTPEQRN